MRGVLNANRGEGGLGDFVCACALSKVKGPGNNCSSEFTFRMLQSNTLDRSFLPFQIRTKTPTYFYINIFYEVRVHHKMLALFQCPACLASKVHESTQNFHTKVWLENQILFNDIGTVPYSIAYQRLYNY